MSRILTLSFILFLVVIALRETGVTAIQTFMTTYLVEVRGLSEATASLVFGLGPAIGAVGALGGGYIGEKSGPKKSLSLWILGCALSLFVLALTPQLYFLSIIYLVYSFFSNGVWTPMNTIVSEMAPRTERGLSFSVYFFIDNSVAALAPVLAATVIEISSISYIFPFSLVLIVASLILLQFFSLPKHPPT